MGESEMLYSARQVTESLDCSPQMAGRYFQALEKITKTKIKTHGRDGRQFDSPTRDVLLTAREIVRSQNGVTVEDAVRRALSLSQVPVETELWQGATDIDLLRLRTLLSESITEPLKDEIRALRLEVQELKQGRDFTQPAPKIENSGKVENQADRQHGLLVRLALWIEQRVRGSNSG